MTRFRFAAFSAIALCAWTTLALIGCAGSEQRTYEKAIRDSAVRGSDWDAPLWPMPAGVVSVSTFTEDAALDVRTLYVWVGATQEIWQKCKQQRDAILRLQELLGLPPQKNPKPGNQWHFFVFDVDSRDLIRPCPGGVDTGLPQMPRGVGWTYDWDPASKNHRGISEFVVNKTAVISDVQSMSPADFCRAPAPPVGH